MEAPLNPWCAGEEITQESDEEDCFGRVVRLLMLVMLLVLGTLGSRVLAAEAWVDLTAFPTDTAAALSDRVFATPSLAGLSSLVGVATVGADLMPWSARGVPAPHTPGPTRGPLPTQTPYPTYTPPPTYSPFPTHTAGPTVAPETPAPPAEASKEVSGTEHNKVEAEPPKSFWERVKEALVTPATLASAI